MEFLKPIFSRLVRLRRFPTVILVTFDYGGPVQSASRPPARYPPHVVPGSPGFLVFVIVSIARMFPPLWPGSSGKLIETFDAPTQPHLS